jgi:hypothetical protein
MTKVFGSVVSSAIAGLMTSNMALAEKAAPKKEANAKTEMVCKNNTCKGHASCTGFGNASCAGKNECAGYGTLNKSDKASCEKDKKGVWTELKK